MKRVLAVLAVASVGACARSPDDAATLAAHWLESRQSDDGAFRSPVYGVLRAGISTTALVAAALDSVVDDAPMPLPARHRVAIEKALTFLESAAGDGAASDYPNYTAALHLRVFGAQRPDGWRAHADRIVARLRLVQCGEARGVARENREHGGFDLGATDAALPRGAAVPDLSTTAWVCEGLRAVDLVTDDPLLADARAFVLRCGTPDGGFLFFPPSPHRPSKAGDGVAYGSATADGLRALIACGVPADDPRAIAARRWLEERGDPSRVPGFDDAHSAFADGLRAYWLASAALALRAADGSPALRDAFRVEAARLLRSDGSWANPSPLMKEDDPLVATALLLFALAR